MSKNSTGQRLCRLIRVGTAFAALGVAVSAHAAGDPIKIGVIGEESAVAGASITKAAQLAADEINAHGGVDGRMIQIITTTTTPRRPTGFAPFSALPPRTRS